MLSSRARLQPFYGFGPLNFVVTGYLASSNKTPSSQALSLSAIPLVMSLKAKMRWLGHCGFWSLSHEQCVQFRVIVLILQACDRICIRTCAYRMYDSHLRQSGGKLRQRVTTNTGAKVKHTCRFYPTPVYYSVFTWLCPSFAS